MKNSFEIDFEWKNHFTIENNIIKQKEHSEIEFKESFHSPKSRDKKLLKWISSFANATGGLIIFGIRNNGEILGLKNNKLKEFDNKELTQELLNFFAPEIKFELFLKTISDLELGFLYVHKSENKPTIAIKSADNNIQEGDVFYRYPGQSRRISYGDFKRILEENYNKLNERWISLISNVATIGVDNVGLLNVINGELIGSNNKLLISKDLLNKVKFINEGTFVEKDGAPTLKLIGDVQPVNSDKIIQVIENKYKIITYYELYNAFFNEELQPDDAKEFFRKVLYESSIYFPIYFYLIKSKLSYEEILGFLKKEQSYNNNKILERFEKEKDNYSRFEVGNIGTGTTAADKIYKSYQSLKNCEEIVLSNLSDLELRYILQAITHLKKSEIEIQYIRITLKKIYDNYFSKSSITKTFIRKSICHIDLIECGQKFFEYWKK